MSHSNRTPVPLGRRIALSFGTAAAATSAAALIGMGAAPVAGAVVDADPVSDLVAALDPNAFILGVPDDGLGLLAAGLDQDLLAPLGLGALLDPIIDDLVGTPLGAASVLDADPISDLVSALDPNAFVLGVPVDALGLLAAGLDQDLLAPLGLGALLDPVIDALVGSPFA
jgi:hypothetical protein